MRVLTFLHSFEPGGVERIALRLVRQWRQEGIEARLFMGRENGAMRTELAADLPYDSPARPKFSISPIETLWMIARLPRFIRQTTPDILFCAGNSYTVVAIAMKLRLGQRCPPIVAKISNDLERRDMVLPVRLAYRLWLRLQGRLIDGFVGMASPMETEIARSIRPRSGQIAIIPDPALSQGQIEAVRKVLPLRRGQDGLHFVSVGRLAPQKNFALMIRAFARGAGAKDRLTIFGEGAERAALARLIEKLGLGDRVLLAGHVPEPAARLVNFDLFLLTSNYEGVPAVLLEALAAGLPIITTRSSVSIGSMLLDGVLGHIVAVGDEPALADAIGRARNLRQDPQASLHQAHRFTLEDASAAYAAAFSDVLDHVEEKSRPELRRAP